MSRIETNRGKAHSFLLGKLNIGSTFEDVVAYAMTKKGAIDMSLLASLEGRFGRNGGRGYDVQKGPCSCGAWH